MSVGTLHVGGLDGGFHEPHRPAAEDEQVADLQLLNEISSTEPSRRRRIKTSTKLSDTIVPMFTRNSRAIRG